MDRVVCGDVGSVRRRSRCAPHSSPCRAQAGGGAGATTLLAQQHYQTFADASPTAVKIELLSRFRATPRRRLRSQGCGGHGGYRHRHAQAAAAGVRFKDSVLIIDEEHRFGVRDKESSSASRRGGRAHAHRDTDPAPLTWRSAACATSRSSPPAAARLSIKPSLRMSAQRSARPACASCAAADRSTTSTTR